jgi:acetate CoA/acetoacetate CoA-transferase beta subunit
MSTKQKLDSQTMALRAATEFQEGMTINLGYGIPSMCANFVPEGREVLFHTENGCLGYGGVASKEEATLHLMNAGGMPVTRRPGMSFFDHAESFCMIRGRHLDLTVLGGLQVSERGDLANWIRARLGDQSVAEWIRVGGRAPTIGGAMDLAVGAKKVMVIMTHVAPDGAPKIVKECTYELTAKRCVNVIITDIAVVEVATSGLVLKEVAPGFTPNDIQSVTEPELIIDPLITEIQL